ncbi:MAG: hypothetical protein IH911_01205 [Proteobacteria bacterium]|nr:hypothetical protein [Pseudomonadota bacterium]
MPCLPGALGAFLLKVTKVSAERYLGKTWAIVTEIATRFTQIPDVAVVI